MPVELVHKSSVFFELQIRNRVTIYAISILLFLLLLTPLVPPVKAQQPDNALTHPHLFFDSDGLIELRNRVLFNPRLNKIWQRFKTEKSDSSFKLQVSQEGISELELGREYGDALGDLTIAYIVLQDTTYANRAIQMMLELARLTDWGNDLAVGHISMGFAFAWDVMYQLIPDSTKSIIKQAVLTFGDNTVANDVYTNINWTASAGEGLLGLAFEGDGNAGFNDFVGRLFRDSKLNFKEDERSVLWGHGTDGFPHQGLGYWRKYIHIGLFFQALRLREPANDWFHLGPEYPGSEFLKNTGYPRIYADVQSADLATLTWADSRQVRTKPGLGPFGNIALMTLIASEYDDGHVMDFVDYLLNETGARFDDEDWATFLFYDDTSIPISSYRDLPLSRYWPDMEAAIFRSGWDKDDMVFYMRSGSPGGHGRFIKQLAPGGHDHPDANAFVIFYDNDYLAAEDGAFPQSGPDEGNKKITYGHNTFLIDGLGQKGDRTNKPTSTSANMDYLDSEHVGYLLGDATDAYDNISKFYRYVIYRKHKYFVMLDELADEQATHKYEYLLGTDSRHAILANGENEFIISPQSGTAEMPVLFVEPRSINYEINRDRPYAMDVSMVDLMRVSPITDSTHATFFTLLYPKKLNEQPPQVEKLYLDSIGVTGLRLEEDEYHLYNRTSSPYQFGGLLTDAKLCYYKDRFYEFEYLTSGSKQFIFKNRIGITSSHEIVASFKQQSGKIRIGKNAGPATQVEVTLYYPGIQDVVIDGQSVAPTAVGPGWMRFILSPKQYEIGPSRNEQTVTDNYDVEIIAAPLLKVQRPNGGELLRVGTIYPISWQADSMITNVDIDYSVDFGATWQLVASAAPNTGAFDWSVPDNVSAAAMLNIRNSDGNLPFDMSDAAFAIDKPPTVRSFSPTQGPPGTQISIYGENFQRVTNVLFGETAVGEFTLLADTLLQVVVPETAPSGPIQVVNQAGVASSSIDFRVITGPAIDSFSPPEGPVGSVVKLLGLNFFDVSEVSFGGARTANFLVITDTLLQATVPEQAKSGQIGIANPLGVGLSESLFRVKRAPQVISFSPEKGPVGSRVEITGSNFLDANSVHFGEVAADTFHVSSDSLLITWVPAAASAAPMSVINPLGSGDSEAIFIVTYPPEIDDFLPRSGPVATQVRIRGRHFLGASRVTFGEMPALFFEVISDSELLATVPQGAETAPVSVTNAEEITLSTQFFVVYQSVRNMIFNPRQDTYINALDVTATYGDKRTLRVEAGSFRSYLKFELSGINGNVRSAIVRLLVENDSDHGGLIYSTSNFLQATTEPWIGSTLTWENAPEIQSSPLDSLAAVDLATWVEFDVTEAVAEDGVFSFSLINPSTNQVEYGSIESDNPPELIIMSEVEPDFLPRITSFSPASATAGQEVVINGTRLNEVDEVRFNGFPADAFVVDSFTRLRAQVPVLAASGPIAVVSYAGPAFSTNDFEFIRPVIDSTFTFTPVGDAYVRSAKADRNYGSSEEMQAASSAYSRTQGYLKFEVNGLVGTLQRAALSLFLMAGSRTGAIFQTENTFLKQDKFWDESEITWTNAPRQKGAKLTSADNPSAGSIIEFDLTRVITGDGSYSFTVVNDFSDKIVFSSKEGPHAPVLTIVTDSNAENDDVDLKPPAVTTATAIPEDYALSPNYPNPFNASTKIDYALPEMGHIRLVVYNLLGQEVKVLANEIQSAGHKSVNWNGFDENGKPSASGVYFLRMQAGGHNFSRKILLQK